jgi:hypothetical protein
MKSLGAGFLFALMLAPQFARAETYIDPWMLGLVEGATDYCAKADPRNARRLEEFESNLLGALPKQGLSSARTARSYDAGKSLGRSMYADLPKAATLASCADFTDHSMAQASANAHREGRSENDRNEKESGERR